jgi:hypothetical protein
MSSRACDRVSIDASVSQASGLGEFAIPMAHLTSHKRKRAILSLPLEFDALGQSVCSKIGGRAGGTRPLLLDRICQLSLEDDPINLVLHF